MATAGMLLHTTTTRGAPPPPPSGQASCRLCSTVGYDVRIMTCGCFLHARCCPITPNRALVQCPVCFENATSIQLTPMSFEEMDQAKRHAALLESSDKKKRKSTGVPRLVDGEGYSDDVFTLEQTNSNSITTLNNTNNTYNINVSNASSSVATGATNASMTTTGSTTTTTGTVGSIAPQPSTTVEEHGELRTGRWTHEETEYCDALIQYFGEGKLPIPEGLKLNEFLANMLKSKQARLTKKMKNAKLATRQYKRTIGYIAAPDEACAFSRLELEFLTSIKCSIERAEIRFHVQKEWRELFSTYCIAMGQTLDANAWLSSIEELDQRMSIQKDAARMVRRKVMLGHALSYDAYNSMQRGVYIDAMSAAITTNEGEGAGASTTNHGSTNSHVPATVSQSSLTSEGPTGEQSVAINRAELLLELAKNDHNPMKYYSSPFIEKVVKLLKRLNIPFEHVDAWVPSFVSNDNNSESATEQKQKCRLCFAGCATTENKIATEDAQLIPLTHDEKFDLLSFGEYSEKFSFDIGCGLPGRVYSSGVASWEQGIQNAPLSQFERSGGASQWGIQTVLGIPIPSPTAGRIVVLFYSTLNRPRNLAMVTRISEALSKLRPSPKWKLVVDVGIGPPPKFGNVTDEENILHHELLALIQTCTPEDKNSPLAAYLPGFTSLRLLLVQQSRSPKDDELLKSVLSSYASYKKGGHRSNMDIASMTARDFMLLSKLNGGSTPRMESVKLPEIRPRHTLDQHQIVDQPDPHLAAALISLHRHAGVAPNVQAVPQATVAMLGHQKESDVTVEGVLQNFMVNQFAGHDFHASPMLHPIFVSQEQYASLGVSPTLHPILNDNVDALTGLQLIGLSSAQMTTAQDDASKQYCGLQ